MKFNWKWLRVPYTNETIDVPAIQMWEVRWLAVRTPSYTEDAWRLMLHATAKENLEAFTSEEEAEEFATSLRNAFELTRHTGSHTNVRVKKAR